MQDERKTSRVPITEGLRVHGHKVICVCVFIEKLPGDYELEHSRREPPSPASPRTLTKKLLFSLCPPHMA